MRAQELSGNSAHGFRERKAVFRPQAVLVAMHEPPRFHEPRILVSARPNHWHLTPLFYFTLVTSLSYSARGIIGWAMRSSGGIHGTGAAQDRLLYMINSAST